MAMATASVLFAAPIFFRIALLQDCAHVVVNAVLSDVK